jgi:hypothetical protein
MLSGPGYPPIVTAVMKVSNREEQKGSGGVRQHYADLTQHQLLLVGHNQKLESAAQASAITHHGAHLHDVRRERDGKLQGNNFAGLHLTAECRPDAVLAEFAGSAPACGRQAFAKHRHLNARVKRITEEAPPPVPVSFRFRLCVVAQSSFSISDLRFRPAFPKREEKGDQPSPTLRVWADETLLRLCFSIRAALNGIKVHVPKK